VAWRGLGGDMRRPSSSSWSLGGTDRGLGRPIIIVRYDGRWGDSAKLIISVEQYSHRGAILVERGT